MKLPITIASLLLSVGELVAAPPTEPVSLVEAGRAVSVIAIPAKEEENAVPGSWSKLPTNAEEAAAELSTHLKQISGAEIAVRKLNPGESERFVEECRSKGLSAILLGSIALERLKPLDPKAKEALDDPSGFLITAGEGVVAVAGSTPAGTSCGVYALLEQLGVRWYFPGELGTIIPTAPSIAIPAQTTVEKPTFRGRYFPVGNQFEWMKRQRMGGPFFPAAHGIKIGEVSPETHPQLFALSGGVRKRHQLCISNPEVLSRAVEQATLYFRANPQSPWLGIGPADGSGFCECDGCRALDAGDWDPFSNCVSMTDRYIWFFNQVLERLPAEFSDKKLAFYIYHAYMRPPVKVKPDPRIAGALAPIGLCRVHGLGNPVCPERGYLKKLIHDWAKVLPELYERGYWFNLADPGMPFIQTHRLRDEIPYYAEQKIQGFRTESSGNWVLQGPSLYLAGRLLWNAGADPDAIEAEFCEKLFGPAAEPMKRYFADLDQTMRDADHHTGSAFNLLQFYPEETRLRLRKLLAEAKSRAVSSPYKERVAIFSTGFDYSDAFARMIECRDRQEWENAHNHLQEMDRLRGELAALQPPMLNERSSESHLSRFFRTTIEKGYERTRNGNRMVAPLADRWESLLDPQNLGQDLQYQRGDLKGGNWQPVATYSTTWSDLGLRYYKGMAWYRQEVEIPKTFAKQRIFLWFGGVDESARVWVNGQLLGTSSPSAFVPFEVDATPAIRPGEKNSVVICVANLKTNELGTGGITAPAFFYAPAAGAKAELELLKPLRETFP